jgi:hypothetical protein
LQRADELIVRVGDYKRHVALPRALAGLHATDTHGEDGRLQITFAKEAASHGRESTLAPAGRRSRGSVLDRLDEMIPPSVRGHLRNARKEVLLAVRAMLDYAIARAETPARTRSLRLVRVR